MVFAEAFSMSQHLKQVINKHFISLSQLLTADEGSLSTEILQTMNTIKVDAMELQTEVHQFSKICHEDFPSTTAFIKEVDNELTSCLLLIGKFDETSDLETSPRQVPTYLLRVKKSARRLRKQLRRETGYKPGAAKGNSETGSFFYDSATGTTVQISKTSPEPRATIPDKNIGGKKTSYYERQKEEKAAMELPSQEFKLPDFLDELPLKPLERERISRILKFIYTRPLDYKYRIHAMLIGDVDLILGKYLSKTEVNTHLAKACQGIDKGGRQAQGYRTLYRNPEDSRQKERFLLRGKNPEFEAEVSALL